jgi:hypothetical protein
VPNNVSTIHLTLRAEPPTEAQYHYSHGLKKHDGDCQRMIHGHRSNIQIFHNQQRSRAHEQQVAAAWQDIYLVTQEDIVGIQSFHGIECYVMRYQAQQGEFQLSWPVARCDVLNTDSTVELIAEHLLHKLVAAEPTSEWMVKAYEGVHKGAYAHYVPAAAHKDTP